MLYGLHALLGALVLQPSPLPPRGVSRARAPVMAGEVDFPELDGKSCRIGIITARWHPEIIDSLVAGAKEAFKECGVSEDNLVISEVPGAFELPLAARYMALSGTVDAILPVGVLIKGETLHFEVISDSVTSGLMNVGLQTGVPVLFGVLTAMTEKQALERATGSNNHGIQWGKAAVEMALLRTSAIGKAPGDKLFLGFGTAAPVADKGGAPAEKPARVGF